MGGSARRDHWLKIVLLEWACATVGTQEGRRNKKESAVSRRKEFFRAGRGGHHLHLERKPRERGLAVPGRVEPRANSAVAQPSPRDGEGGTAKEGGSGAGSPWTWTPTVLSKEEWSRLGQRNERKPHKTGTHARHRTL